MFKTNMFVLLVDKLHTLGSVVWKWSLWTITWSVCLVNVTIYVIIIFFFHLFRTVSTIRRTDDTQAGKLIFGGYFGENEMHKEQKCRKNRSGKEDDDRRSDDQAKTTKVNASWKCGRCRAEVSWPQLIGAANRLSRFRLQRSAWFGLSFFGSKHWKTQKTCNHCNEWSEWMNECRKRWCSSLSSSSP